MSFRFSTVCELLEKLESLESHDGPVRIADEKACAHKKEIQTWFKAHRQKIDDLNAESTASLLSTLFPERRTDRIYELQAPRMCRVLSRCLALSAQRTKDLQAYKQPGYGDLGECVQRALKAGGPPALPPITVDEVDQMLDILAGFSRFSGPAFKRFPPGSSEIRDLAIRQIFSRATPIDGKWLVRSMLKDFAPVIMDEHTVLKSFHFLLPELLRFQDNFSAVTKLLKTELREYHANPDFRSELAFKRSVGRRLKPVVGTKVGRPYFMKGRSINQCLERMAGRKWVVERKYDGEYCEVHIDRTKSEDPRDCIQIFSKSGKDSTADRRALRNTLIDSLHLRQPGCIIKSQAILLGELLVWSDKTKDILPFERIRTHVSRSGVFLGTDKDSQPREHEHLAIVFFDILLLDDEVVMRRDVSARRTWLKNVYEKLPGRVMSADWKIIDLSQGRDQERAKKSIMQQFAAAIAERCEGLILKPCDMPYFPIAGEDPPNVLPYIKLKKDYMADMGDEADFAVIGAAYSSQRALKSGVPGLQFTDFHLGCLVNEEEAIRFGQRPRFRVVGTIRAGESCIPRAVLQSANDLSMQNAQLHLGDSEDCIFDLHPHPDLPMETVLRVPFVFEVLGSGFEKAPNQPYLMLRHPRVKKLHQDRTWKDCVTFNGLAQQAANARNAPKHTESQETRAWLAKLERKYKRKIESQRCSPKTNTTATSSTMRTGAIALVKQPTGGSLATRETLVKANGSAIKARGKQSNAVPLLIGFTLVDSDPQSKMKRPVPTSVEGSPCPTSKRRKIRNSQGHYRGNRGIMLTGVVAPKPLADITNIVRRPTRHDHRTQNEVNSKSPTIHALQMHSRLPLKPFFPNTAMRWRCEASLCVLSSTAVCLVPCIASTPYVAEDLLVTHDVIIDSQLSHWDRDSFAHPTLTGVVAESQAHIDRRKVVLVESKRREAVILVLQQILRLNEGRFRERVEVYDWRLLEQCSNHDLAADLAKHYSLGATMFDASRGKAIFVSRLPWLQTEFGIGLQT